MYIHIYIHTQDDNSIPLTTRVSVGPNCEVEYETELAEVSVTLC